MSLKPHRDHIIGALVAGLGTADLSQGKTHEAKSTKGAAFELTHRADGERINLYVRRAPDLDAFTLVVIDWSVAEQWSARVWTTSQEPQAAPETTWSFTRPKGGVDAVVAEVRALAGKWLHAEGGLRTALAADLVALAAASNDVAGDA